MNKEERKIRFKTMSSNERKALILKKMKTLGIDVGVEFLIKNMIVVRFMN